MRRGVRTAVLSTVAAVLATAAAPPSRAGPPAPILKGTLKGQVENEKQQPVAGAEISVDVPGRAPITATTDAAGAFSMTGVPIGDVTVRIRAKGCFPQDQHVVVAGKGVTSLRATLKIGVRYAGKVSDARGSPIAGVRVRAVIMLREDRITADDFWGATSVPVVSAADGSYAVEGLEPAKRWALRFKHPHYEKQEVKDLPTKAGTSKEDVDVSMADAAWVTGVVLDEAGKPVAKAQLFGDPDWPSSQRHVVIDLSPDDEDGMSVEAIRTDKDGKFVVGGITEASAEIGVEADGFFPVKVPLTALEVGKERSGIEVRLEKATATVEGYVVDKKNRPIPETWVTAHGDCGSKEGTTDKSGHFRLAKIPTHTTVKLTAGGSEWLEGSIEGVAPGAKDVKVVLQRAPRLRLKVTDVTGTPIPQVTIRVRAVAAPDATDEDKRRRRRTDQTGEQPATGYELVVPFVGEVEAVLVAEGYETTKAGPWTATAGASIAGGTVAMKAKTK